MEILFCRFASKSHLPGPYTGRSPSEPNCPGWRILQDDIAVGVRNRAVRAPHRENRRHIRAGRIGVTFDASAFEAEVTPLLAGLQGEWIPAQLIQNGDALPEMMLAMGSRSFIDNETKVVFGGQVMVHAKVRIDDSQSPIAVDYLNVGEFSTGQISFGVMEWLEDEVRFCMSGPGQPRPLDFSCEPGSGRTFSRWKRK